jgi:hypothetical protein
MVMPDSVFADRERRSFSLARSAHQFTGGPGWRSAGQDEARSVPPRSAAPRVSHDFSRVSVYPVPPRGTVHTTTIPFRAVVRDSGGGSPGRSKTAAHREAASSLPAERDGDTLYIAQMGGPSAVVSTTGAADTVLPTFAYAPTTIRGAPLGAGDFGVTFSHLNPFSDVLITPAPFAGVFTVTAGLKHDLTWDTRTDQGPEHQVNIMSPTDTKLTRTNYPHAVTSLTPDMTDLKGRPPRTGFWSRDLTEKHEGFHVTDFIASARKEANDAAIWVAGQGAATRHDVLGLLKTARDKAANAVSILPQSPSFEEHAYSQGAPDYKARADAIKAKGDKGTAAAGGYPP